MGKPLAERLTRAGVPLAVWNRTPGKAEAVVRSGAEHVNDQADLAGRDVVFTMVTGSAELESVVTRLFTDPGRAPRFLIDCSTVSAAASSRVRVAAGDRGTAFLAAPVSGNGKVGQAGLLSVVVSGPRDAFEAVEHLIAMLGRHVSYVGEGELARLAKICHNLLLGVVAQNLAEITVLAEKAGMPRASFLDFINNSVMGSMFTRYKSPALVHLDFTPTFTPVLLQKISISGWPQRANWRYPCRSRLRRGSRSVGGRPGTDGRGLRGAARTAGGQLRFGPQAREHPVDDGLSYQDPPVRGPDQHDLATMERHHADAIHRLGPVGGVRARPGLHAHGRHVRKQGGGGIAAGAGPGARAGLHVLRHR